MEAAILWRRTLFSLRFVAGKFAQTNPKLWDWILATGPPQTWATCTKPPSYPTANLCKTSVTTLPALSAGEEQCRTFGRNSLGLPRNDQKWGKPADCHSDVFNEKTEDYILGLQGSVSTIFGACLVNYISWEACFSLSCPFRSKHCTWWNFGHEEGLPTSWVNTPLCVLQDVLLFVHRKNIQYQHGQIIQEKRVTSAKSELVSKPPTKLNIARLSSKIFQATNRGQPTRHWSPSRQAELRPNSPSRHQPLS